MPYRGHHRSSGPAGAVVRAVAAAVATAALVATAAVVVAVPSNAAEPYTATGSLRHGSTGFGVTDSEFAAATCPDEPATQGQDGWVFVLPEAVAVEGAHVAVAASPAQYSLHAYVYGADCLTVRGVTGAAGGVALDLAAGERYVSVYTTTFGLATVQLALTVTPPGGGTDPTPTGTATTTPTATVTPTATATPTTGRGTYPAGPNDPLFLQNGAGDLLLAGQWGMRKIQAPQAWQEPRSTGAGVKVAVIDTGLDLTHEDFACPGKVLVVPNSDPDPDGSDQPTDDVEGHGTHVAGIVGACTNNGKGVVGVAPDAMIMPIQGLSASITDTIGTVAGAIDTAVANGAHVINMSLSFGSANVVGSAAYLTSTSYAPIEAAVERAVAAGVVVVGSAGNDGSPLCAFPSIAEDVVCVGSTDRRDLKSWYSNFPVKLDNEDLVGPALVAPGGAGEPAFCDFSAEDVISTFAVSVDRAAGDCDGLEGYATIEGTSMAAPHVAGVAALVYDRIGAERSGANGARVVEALLNSAVDLYGPGYDPASGYGRLDALAAVRYFDAAPEPTETAPVAQPTAVSFGAVPASGQFSDTVALEARLTDRAGNGLAAEPLTFQLVGADGFAEVAARTGADGVARAVLPLDTAPGAYDLRVGYAGKQDVWESAGAGRAFTVEREDTTTTLVTSGSGSKRVLAATVADADDAGHRVRGVVVTFRADGVVVGEAVTDASGTATFAPPAGARGTGTAYTAAFGGDARYLASTG